MNIEIEEAVNLEAYAKANKPVPPGKKYQIKVDKQLYVVHVSQMTGHEILVLAGKTPPDRYILQMKKGKHVHKVELNDVVSFLEPGVERFMTIPNEVTEGDACLMRRQFNVLADDESYLNSLGLSWAAVMEGGIQRIVIEGWPLPAGYNIETVQVNVQIPPGYPDTQIDMAYFYPDLFRQDGRPIGALSADSFDGKVWQRWSRHRTANSPWRIGIDSLETHMALVADWLEAELRK